MVLGQTVQWDWTSLSYKFKLMNIRFKNKSELWFQYETSQCGFYLIQYKTGFGVSE